MITAGQFLKEFDPEMAATRRMLERVPASKVDWKPHAKSKSLGELATHIAELPRWGCGSTATPSRSGANRLRR